MWADMVHFAKELDKLSPSDRHKILDDVAGGITVRSADGELEKVLFHASQCTEPGLPLSWFLEVGVKAVMDPMHLWIRISEGGCRTVGQYLLSLPWVPRDDAATRKKAVAAVRLFSDKLSSLAQLRSEAVALHDTGDNNKECVRPSLNGIEAERVLEALPAVLELFKDDLFPEPESENAKTVRWIAFNLRTMWRSCRPGGAVYEATFGRAVDGLTKEQALANLRVRANQLALHWCKVFPKSSWTHSMHLLHVHCADHAASVRLPLWHYAQDGCEHQIQAQERLIHHNVSHTSSGTWEGMLMEMARLQEWFLDDHSGDLDDEVGHCHSCHQTGHATVRSKDCDCNKKNMCRLLSVMVRSSLVAQMKKG